VLPAIAVTLLISLAPPCLRFRASISSGVRVDPPELLAATASTPSIEAPLDEYVDVLTLSHWCRAGMPRRMVDQVGLIIGRFVSCRQWPAAGAL
jgi:hypothetical protein